MWSAAKVFAGSPGNQQTNTHEFISGGAMALLLSPIAFSVAGMSRQWFRSCVQEHTVGAKKPCSATQP